MTTELVTDDGSKVTAYRIVGAQKGERDQDRHFTMDPFIAPRDEQGIPAVWMPQCEYFRDPGGKIALPVPAPPTPPDSLPSLKQWISHTQAETKWRNSADELASL